MNISKMKSLIQTLFDENDEAINETAKEENTRPKHSLAMFLNSTRDDSMDIEKPNRQIPIYVEDTDNEDE